MYNQLAQPTPQSQVGMEGVANWSSPNSAIACTVSSPCGFSQGYASNFNHYAYILSTESIVILSQNLLEGTLTPISYTPTLGNSVSMLNSLDGKYIYVADGTANKIQIFGVNTVDGSLNLLNEVNTGTQPNYGSLSFDPAGKFLYSTATSSDNVSVFAYAESSGNLTLTQQIASGTNPYITTFTPDGKYAYITNSLGVLPPNVSDQAYISMFAVESSSGHLTPLAIPTIQSLANSPFASLIDPGGRYLYVTNTGGISAGVEYAESTVSIYDIDDVTGQLSYHVGQESFVVGTAPTAIIADPLYKYMYVANALGSSVSMMNINAVNGNLTGLASIDSSGIYPGSMAFGPGSKYLYVVNAISNTVQIFLVNHTTGELSQYDNPMPLGITAPKMSAYIIFGK
jgi:6-phosphogluconolactonase (cycloisomerase 2 family)